MTINRNSNNMVKNIRSLVRTYTSKQIDHCLAQQLNQGNNQCLHDSHSDRIIDTLSKAGYVRMLIDNGEDERAALRMLGQKMRQWAA